MNKNIHMKYDEIKVNDFIRKTIKKFLILFVFTGAMFLGSSIQLYISKVSEINLPNGVTFWHKLCGFFMFSMTKEFKGSFSEQLYNLCHILLFGFLILFIFKLYFFVKEERRKSVKN